MWEDLKKKWNADKAVKLMCKNYASELESFVVSQSVLTVMVFRVQVHSAHSATINNML